MATSSLRFAFSPLIHRHNYSKLLFSIPTYKTTSIRILCFSSSSSSPLTTTLETLVPPPPSNHSVNNTSPPKKKLMKSMKLTFKVHENTILSAPWLALTNNNSRNNLLPEIWLTFLHSSHNHIADTSRRKSIKPPLDSLDFNDVQILSIGVIGTGEGGFHRRR